MLHITIHAIEYFCFSYIITSLPPSLTHLYLSFSLYTTSIGWICQAAAMATSWTKEESNVILSTTLYTVLPPLLKCIRIFLFYTSLLSGIDWVDLYCIFSTVYINIVNIALYNYCVHPLLSWTFPVSRVLIPRIPIFSVRV